MTKVAAIHRAPKALPARRIRELSALARRIDREEGRRIIARGRQVKRQFDELRGAVAALKAERLRQKLTLEEVGNRMGIGKANLSRLENAATPNPTVETLLRYASAVGGRLLIRLESADMGASRAG